MMRNPFRRRWALGLVVPGYQGPPVEIQAFWLRSSAVLAAYDYPASSQVDLLVVVRRDPLGRT